jgi:hypothetical protein
MVVRPVMLPPGRQALRQPQSDRIGVDDGDDRYRRGCPHGGEAFAGAGDHDDVHRPAHQIGDVTVDQLVATAGEAPV